MTENVNGELGLTTRHYPTRASYKALGPRCYSGDDRSGTSRSSLESKSQERFHFEGRAFGCRVYGCLKG